MELKPVKNYRKPSYAKGLAVTLAAVSTLSGCKDEPNLAGDVPNTTDTEIYSETVETCTTSSSELIVPDGMIATETEETEEAVLLDGDVAFVEESEMEDYSFHSITLVPNTTTTMRSPEISGTVVVTDDTEPESTTKKPEATAPITTTTMKRPETVGTVVVPDDDDDSPVLELEGEIAVTEETEEEPFALEGDVAVFDDDYNYESDDSEEQINDAYYKGLEYASDIKKYLDKNGRPVKLYDDMSHIFETGDNGHLVVPIALEGSKYKMWVAFYNSGNPSDPLVTMLENNDEAYSAIYGYTYREFEMTYFFIDVAKLSNNTVEKIASAICLEELNII